MAIISNDFQQKLLDQYVSKFERPLKFVLSHEYGNGSLCNRCDCPGLDLHYWRKICKNCSCRLDEHDILLPNEQDHGAIMTQKLFARSKKRLSGSSTISSSTNNSTSSSVGSPENFSISRALHSNTNDNSNSHSFVTAHHSAAAAVDDDANGADAVPVLLSVTAVVDQQQQQQHHQDAKERDAWTWTPAGDWRLARRYLLSLPEAQRPLKGAPGAQLRRQRLAQQLPYHDSDVEHSKLQNRTEHEQKLHSELIAHIKQRVVGIAEIVDYAQHGEHFAKKMPSSTILRRMDGSQSPRCKNCQGQFKCTDVGLITDHEKTNGEAIWHPTCFTCSVCQQLLADLLYFYRDGKYFCGRHYVERLYPRCFGCDELIFAREYTFAEEKSWHLEHFCCLGCDRHLSGHQYIVKDEQPFCVDCYMEKFARVCLTCSDKIAPFDQRVSYAELHWHADGRCFKCGYCNRPLSNEKFLLKETKPFCSTTCKKTSENLSI